MSERFKVTKSEDPNSFPNYGATTGMDADDNHGKMTAETDAKQPSSSLEETIGRREQKYVLISSLPQACVLFTVSVVCACDVYIFFCRQTGPFIFVLYVIHAFYHCEFFFRFSSLFPPASLNQ